MLGLRSVVAAPTPPPDRDESKRVRVALSTLSSVQREAIVLFELEGMGVAEIARIQQVSASAVKSRLARGRQKLRVVYVKRFGFSDASTLAKGTQ